MYQLGNEDISSWAARIDTVIGHTPHPVIERVVVVESTDSTQNAALRFAQGRNGLLVVASMQKNGRGARGRRWHDGDRATLPCTFVVDPGCKDAPMLAACVACAVHEAINSFLPRVIQLGIKWPNDLVIRDEHVDRKIAGVLIEQQQGLTLVGIGINCTQTQRDWSPEYADRAVSFLGLGVSVSRLDLICRVVESMSQWFHACDRAAIRSYYEIHNAMVGTRRAFRHNNRVYEGVVEHLDPLESIVLSTKEGTCTLPVDQTQHLRRISSDDSELRADA
jgi:BirA family biotin operon repressor/biotin-[acetyl-CoA-carboxylase] ligase